MVLVVMPALHYTIGIMVGRHTMSFVGVGVGSLCV